VSVGVGPFVHPGPFAGSFSDVHDMVDLPLVAGPDFPWIEMNVDITTRIGSEDGADNLFSHWDSMLPCLPESWQSISPNSFTVTVHVDYKSPATRHRGTWRP
jgi:hypothetical protein